MGQHGGSAVSKLINQRLRAISLTRWCDAERERSLELRHIRPLPLPRKKQPLHNPDEMDEARHVILQLFNA